MICLSSKAIMILMEDGSKLQFDPESYQTKLLKCCLMAGVKEFWIAEDLTNVIEEALVYHAEKGIFFTEKEINSLISKMLDDSGNHSIGAAFRMTYLSDSEELQSAELFNIKRVIERTFQPGAQKLKLIADKVHSACKTLNIKNLPENLLIELARYYRNQAHGIEKVPSLITEKRSYIKTLSCKNKILESLPGQVKYAIEKGVLNFDGIGSIFPSIKVEMKFMALAALNNLEPIITELQLFPCFPMAVDALNELISCAVKNINELETEKEREIPVYLKFSDIYLFSEKYFGINLSKDERFCRELAGAFAENLNYNVKVRFVKI